MDIKDIEIETWDDLAKLLAKMTPEQRSQRVQIAMAHPDDEHVHELQQGIAFAPVGVLELRYCRSAVDNRHHEEEFVIFTDGNPHAENGATAYEWDMDKKGPPNKENPIYPEGHDESADWSGPAQKLREAQIEKKQHPKVHDQCVICSRVNRLP